MPNHSPRIAAGEFKAKCLQLMDQVHDTHVSLIITKHGVPIAKLVPIDDEPMKLFGAQQGCVDIKDNITTPIDKDWDADK